MVQQRRRRLIGLPLTGWRHSLRAGTLTLVIWLAGVCALLHVFERHRADESSGWFDDHDPEWGPAHSLAGETYYLPLIAPLLVLAAALWARRGFPRAILPAVLAAGNVIVLIGAWVNAHLFEGTDDPALTIGAILTGIALGGVGLWLLIVEIVLPFLERRRLEADDPVFPTARVV